MPPLAVRRWFAAIGLAAGLCTAGALPAAAAGNGGDPAPLPSPSPIPGKTLPRVEARSATLLAVGIVQGDRMTIHVSRLLDNAPVRDAAVNVLLRGVLHPTKAEADGSFTLQTRDLDLPGLAGMVFQVTVGGIHDDLRGELRIADDTGKPQEENSARQLWWWVLNFAVCIGFLMLLARRRKTTAPND